MGRKCLIVNIAVLVSLLFIGQALAAGMKTEDRSLNSEQISEMQKILDSQGYKVDDVNGVLNDSTREAIRQFQEAQGLVVTGMPNEETLRALAPDSKQQEFFGLSPEFSEPGGMQNQEQPGNMQKQEQNKQY